MEKVTGSEELRQRLIQASGEDVAAFGWGTLGFGNLFVGVTATALILESITIGSRTKELRRIPWDEIEFIYALKGDASTPKMLKMNVQAAVTEAMTGTLLVKLPGERLMNITFRKMPRFHRNDQAPVRIADHVQSIRSDKVFLPDMKLHREKQSFGGCVRNFLLISGVGWLILAVALGLGTGQWELAVYGGLGTAVVLGAVFAPLTPIFKRIMSGRG